MAQGDSVISMLSRRDQLKFLALRVQIPRIHKLDWKEDRVSRDWLEKISALNSSIAGANTITIGEEIEAAIRSIQDNESQRRTSLSGLLKPCNAAPFELQQSHPDESYLDQEPQPLPEIRLEVGMCHGRKPDSTYISLVSQTQIPASFSAQISKRRHSDGNFIVSQSTPEMKCIIVKEHSQPPPVFFTPQVNLEAKRKLSFEYIQEVSKLGCVLQAN